MVEIASKPGEGSVFTVRLPSRPPVTPGHSS
jgi:signal transduction histidine kinase